MQRSVYLGWTGQQSKRKPAQTVGRDGFGTKAPAGKTQDEATVEIDSTFAKLLGLADGQKVCSTAAHGYSETIDTLQ